MGVNETDIHVEIDELVLTGFDRVNIDLLVQAFQRELTRLLHRRGVHLVDEHDLVSGLPALPHTTSARRLGEALARSVHSGLTRGLP